MQVVTFYSYKGGVGRTLALVNVAFELKSRGKKVLLVDFDLEAPGLPSYEDFAAVKGKAGIVDYVTEFMATNEAPNVSDFIVEVDENLFIMPAGNLNNTYSSRLSSIDWQKLYTDHSGFLMFEDMKAQWKSAFNPDYVLIDSRTGHNDIGGICTRQLPDVVVGLFFPNMQNIEGMSVVSRNIVNERTESGRDIDLLIVPSRVPDLDDESGILSKHLSIAERRIGYRRPPVVIHQYDSITLVNDTIFVRDRPKTRLAKEYSLLASEIVKSNIRDEDGAIAFLKSVQRTFQDNDEYTLDDNIWEKIAEIGICHVDNGKVLEEVADLRLVLLEHENAYRILTAVIDRGYRTSSVLRKRAAALQGLGRQEEAIADLKEILNLESPRILDVAAAVRTIASVAPEQFPDDIIDVVGKFPLHEQIRVGTPLTRSEKTLHLAEKVYKNLIKESASTGGDHTALMHAAQYDLALILIGQRKFQEAIELLNESDKHLHLVAWQFNYSMALWGLQGRPNVEEFLKVVQEDNGKRDWASAGSNYNLCIALAKFVCGDFDGAMQRLALSERGLRGNPVPTLSPWRYITVNPIEFKADIGLARRYFSGDKSAGPVVFEQNKAVYH